MTKTWVCECGSEAPERVVDDPTDSGAPCCLWAKDLGADLTTVPTICDAHRAAQVKAVEPTPEPGPVDRSWPEADEEPRRFSRQWALSKYYGCGDGPLNPALWGW